jgi:chromatin structure-remodeling complex subunit SFH1
MPDYQGLTALDRNHEDSVWLAECECSYRHPEDFFCTTEMILDQSQNVNTKLKIEFAGQAERERDRCLRVWRTAAHCDKYRNSYCTLLNTQAGILILLFDTATCPRYAFSVKLLVMAPTQAFVTSYPTRLAKYANAFYTPVIPAATIAPASRTTKRGTTIINYADDAYDDDDFDDSEGQRRPTGLRSLRREEAQNRDAASDRLGKEIYRPVDVQGIYREWMTRRTVKPTYGPNLLLNDWKPEPNNFSQDTYPRTDQQVHIQSQLPLTLIPIRIDIDVPAAQRDPPFPLTRNAQDFGFHTGMPAFQRPEPSTAYKIRDTFLWNLHEALLTPDDFAQSLVRELDLPNQVALAMTISSQIRTQLEEYAGVALHPLFHSQSKPAAQVSIERTQSRANNYSNAATPRPSLAAPTSPPTSLTPGASTPAQDVSALPATGLNVLAEGSLLRPEPSSDVAMQEEAAEDLDPHLNPDDTYRCIIKLTVSLSSRSYSDKFEWSLLHPPGYAEAFARQTCADLGLGGEWVSAITHAIYWEVLKMKKDMCDGRISSGSALVQGDVENLSVRAEEGAGWRYDEDNFGSGWEPRVEVLSKEDIEKREENREREVRRMRRETAKFSSTTGMMPSAREQEAQSRASYFDPPGGMMGGEAETPNMGRGERSKKKRRFRSLSPVAKALETPGEGGAGAGAGWGGEENKLKEYEKQNWRCAWCLVWGTAVWAVRDGPTGPRVSPPVSNTWSKCH